MLAIPTSGASQSRTISERRRARRCPSRCIVFFSSDHARTAPAGTVSVVRVHCTRSRGTQLGSISYPPYSLKLVRCFAATILHHHLHMSFSIPQTKMHFTPFLTVGHKLHRKDSRTCAPLQNQDPYSKPCTTLGRDPVPKEVPERRNPHRRHNSNIIIYAKYRYEPVSPPSPRSRYSRSMRDSMRFLIMFTSGLNWPVS